MDDVIKRVREYGELLAKGSPHQQRLGEDIVLVVEQVKDPLMKIDADGNVTALNADLEKDLHELKAVNAHLTEAHEQLRQQHEQVTKERDELRQQVVNHGAQRATVGSGGAHPLASLAGQNIDLRAGGAGVGTDGKHAGIGTDGTAHNAALADGDSIDRKRTEKEIAEANSDAHLTKAEKKARAKALQDELDKSGKHEPVDGKKK